MSVPSATLRLSEPRSFGQPSSSLHSGIFDQAARQPGAIAVRQRRIRLTYAELCGAASELAHQLVDSGVRPEDRVVVCTDRTPDMLVAVLGVLASGAAYVPVLPGDPARRRAAILADSGARLAVVDGRGAPQVGELGRIAVPSAAGHALLPPPPDPVNHPGHSAYVLFTSGSTGRPKGVVVGHAAVANYALDTAGLCEAGADAVTIGYASLGFDASVIDLFSTLLIGAQLALLDETDRLDPARTQEFLRAHRVSWGYLPPALLALLEADTLPDLTALVVGGDTCPPEQVARWTRSGRRLLNVYGPTETTVCVTMADLHGDWARPVPIGQPTGGHRVYLLDSDLQPVPEGQPGQLHIAGPGVARGYLGRPGTTAAVYLPDPYGPTPGERMYATGDLAVRRTDGLLYFLGRMDRQVKISGQRVELGEIEAAIGSHPDVANVAVDVVQSPTGHRELVAFLSPEQAPGLTRLREHLADRLPAAMVPTRVVALPALPTLAAAKVDLAALRARALAELAATDGDRRAEGGGHADGDDLSDAVHEAWAAALGAAPMADDDDFFSAGGHSLAAMRLVSRLRTALDRDISVSDVFTARTPAAIRAVLAAAVPIAPDTPTTGHRAALGSPQRRLWFLDRLTAGTSAYNIALAQRLRGRLDPDALRRALSDVAVRHEVLRWTIPQEDGQPRVEVSPARPVELPIDRAAQRSDGAASELVRDKAVVDWLHGQAMTGFDLAAGPLWRARLLRLGTEDHVLALTVHHAIFDGWSVEPLYQSVSAAYARQVRTAAGEPHAVEPVAEQSIRYADYIAWAQRRQDIERRPMTQWWVQRLAGMPVVLDLPRDRPRPDVQTLAGCSVRTVLPAVLAKQVSELSTELGVTLQTVLLTAFGILLARLTGQRDLVVGIPAADRRHPDFDDLVGFFVDTLPIPMSIDDGRGFADQVRDVAAEVGKALEHRDAPYEDIVDGLRLPRDLSRNPLVQVLFNVFDVDGARLDLAGVDAQPLEPGLPGSLFDLTLYVDSSTEDLRLQAVFNPDLYDSARITALLDSYRCLVAGAVAHPHRAVGLASVRPAGAPLPDPLGDLEATPAPLGLVETVLAVARAEPDRIAVRGPDSQQTFAELASAASAVARLLGSGAAPVGILARRSALLPAQLLGVLGAGRRWLILDEALPGGWLSGLCCAAGVNTLLIDVGQHVPDELSALALVDPGLAEGGSRATADPSVFLPVEPSTRGYLMATSGTTGSPAIVDTPEQPLAAFLDWYARDFGIGSGDVTVLLSGLGHDPMLRDIFAALWVGGRVCIPGAELLQDPDGLLGLLNRQGVTVLHLTPQLLRLLSAAATAIPSVRLVALAGDRLVGADVELVGRLCPGAVVINGYGSTETPQIQALHRIGSRVQRPLRGPHPVPVGRGRPGVELHIATPGGAPAAVGEVGRVFIRSAHLAAGYLNEVAGRDGFGGNRFLTDRPGIYDSADDRMFATGDLGRYDPDGEVVLAGRSDDQVKVRGRRVGLGEVRAALEEHSSVREAVVIARGKGDDIALVGYVVLHRRQSTEALSMHLEQRLPDYARPANLVALPALPLTANGKVDLAALPPPRTPRRAVTADSEPTSPTEKLIAGIWRDILGVASIGVRDNFFDIGGHSLAIVAVQARLAKALASEIRVVDLFRFPNIAGLAAHLDGAGAAPGLDRAQRRLASRRARRGTSPPVRTGSEQPPNPPETEDPR